MAVVRHYDYRYTVHGVVDVPFRCAACGFASIAHARCDGVGKVSSVLVRPDEQEARRRADAALAAEGARLVDGCPCPRCGESSVALVATLAAYDAAHPGGPRAKRLRVFAVGSSIAGAIALSCMASMVAFPTEGMTARDMLGAALCGGGFLFVVGTAVSGVTAMLVGPPPRPVRAPAPPANVWFDAVR